MQTATIATKGNTPLRQTFDLNCTTSACNINKRCCRSYIESIRLKGHFATCTRSTGRINIRTILYKNTFTAHFNATAFCTGCIQCSGNRNRTLRTTGQNNFPAHLCCRSNSDDTCVIYNIVDSAFGRKSRHLHKATFSKNIAVIFKQCIGKFTIQCQFKQTITV